VTKGSRRGARLSRSRTRYSTRRGMRAFLSDLMKALDSEGGITAISRVRKNWRPKPLTIHAESREEGWMVRGGAGLVNRLKKMINNFVRCERDCGRGLPLITPASKQTTETSCCEREPERPCKLDRGGCPHTSEESRNDRSIHG